MEIILVIGGSKLQELSKQQKHTHCICCIVVSIKKTKVHPVNGENSEINNNLN